MRPVLRPGIHPLRRGDREVQLGLDPGQALVLPRTRTVDRGLALLADGADREAHPDPRLLELLDRHRMLCDERDVLPLLAPRRSSRYPVPGEAVAALARRHGARGPEAHRARTAARFEVAGFGHPAGAAMPERLLGLLREAGLRPVTRHSTSRVGVLVGVGEPDRTLLDRWTRDRTPHLLVRLTEGRAAVGPFVVPGRTACLRCLDAWFTDADPAWPLLVHQYAEASARDRSDGIPEPVDPLLATVALAWAARDLASYAEGVQPSSWSATVSLDPHLVEIETRSWLRHPECGCHWR